MRAPEGYTIEEPPAHGFADVLVIVTCECGTTFEGDHEAQAFSRWAEHCDEAET